MKGTYCRRWTGTSIRIFDVGASAFGYHFKKKCSFETNFVNLDSETFKSFAGVFVGFFDFVGSLTELDAFSAVGLLDGRG